MAGTTSRQRRNRVVLGGVIVFAAALAMIPVPVVAADLRQGRNVTIGSGQTVSDDLYVAGGIISIGGNVNGSVIVAGGAITISGAVSRDLMIAGGTINVTGRVGGSIRVAGGNLTLNGPVEQDVVVAGGMIDIGAGGTIARDLVIAGGMANVSAPVGRRVNMAVGNLTLHGKVGGDVRGRVDQLRLDGAQIGGSLDYTSDNQVQLVNGARVAGTTTRHTPTDRGARAAGGGFLGWLRALIGIFALGLLLILLLPAFSVRAVETLRTQPWVSLAIGAAILIITPIVALIVFIVGLLIGGWWLGLLLIPLYILALALGYVVSGFLLGRLIFRQLGWSGYHPALVLLGGLLVLTVVGVIPVLGVLISLAALVFGAGALALAVSGQTGGRTAAV